MVLHAPVTVDPTTLRPLGRKRPLPLGRGEMLLPLPSLQRARGPQGVAYGEGQSVGRVGGVGISLRLRNRMTIRSTWTFWAFPLPVMASLASVGVCSATGIPRCAAASMARPAA